MRDTHTRHKQLQSMCMRLLRVLLPKFIRRKDRNVYPIDDIAINYFVFVCKFHVLYCECDKTLKNYMTSD